VEHGVPREADAVNAKLPLDRTLRTPSGRPVILPELETLISLWRRERAATRARFAEVRRGMTLAERVARGLALADLQVVDVEPAPGGRLLLWATPRKPVQDPDDVRIGQGDPVRLWFHDPDEPGALRAVVARRQGLRLALMADVEADEHLERLEDGGFRLDLDAPETTFDRGDRALRRFADARPGTPEGYFTEVLFGHRAPRFGGAGVSGPLRDASLNARQREAVERALRSEDVALVHGPPGTGKTRTLVEIIVQSVARGERVLATAASNGAVDNLGLRLVRAGLDVVRLGHPARVAAALESVSLEARLAGTEASQLARRWNAEATALRHRVAARSSRGATDREARRAAFQEARRLQQDARRHLDAAQQAIVENAQVVLATAAGAEATVLGDRVFDVVVLDEATQSPDPISLVALQRARRVVLAGDPRQLPPTVVDLEAARDGLGRTLFERLAERRPEALVRLREQHRMHAALMAFPSDSMYDGDLEAAPAVAGHVLTDLPGVAEDPLRPGPFVFIDTAGTGWTESKTESDPSTFNPQQAARTISEVRRLLARGLPARDIAVITPYEAQARRLREGLREARAAGLEVGTVDAFQGREKEAVVVDLVRSNEAGELGFLNDVRRLNVALTRARRFLLVIGDGATLGGHPYHQSFVEHAESTGAWLSAWADDGEPGPEIVSVA
jgi:predicted DNA helicase